MDVLGIVLYLRWVCNIAKGALGWRWYAVFSWLLSLSLSLSLSSSSSSTTGSVVIARVLEVNEVVKNADQNPVLHVDAVR